MFAQPETEVRASGFQVDLNLQPRTYPTQAAHGLILVAGACGTRHQFAAAISRVYLLAAKSISDAEYLPTLQHPSGLDATRPARLLATTNNVDASDFKLPDPWQSG